MNRKNQKMSQYTNSADVYRLIRIMLRFMYEECQKRSTDPLTPHILAVVDSVEELTQNANFRGDAMKMAMMLISFGRLYQELGGQANIILKVGENNEVH